MPQRMRGTNSQRTKLFNRALILKLLCTKYPISRVEIAKMTQLSKMSVTNVINEFIDKAIVKEIDKLPEEYIVKGKAGRNPKLLEPIKGALPVIGVYISRDSIEVAIIDIRGEIIERGQVALLQTENSVSFIDKVYKLIKNVIKISKIEETKIIGLGIAAIGPIDLVNGIILAPPNFHDIHDINIKDSLLEYFDFPIFMNNDMNASALAEKIFGDARDLTDFIYVGITNGIGAGIVIEDRLFHGHNGFSGEFGHVTVQTDGPLCACGNRGCLEIYANIPNVIAKVESAIELGMETSLEGEVTFTKIVNEAKKGDKLCINVINNLESYIEIGLINMINLFDPQEIFLGHEIAIANDLIIDKLNKEVNQKLFAKREIPIRIATSKFVDKSPVIGSGAIIFDKIFESKLEI